MCDMRDSSVQETYVVGVDLGGTKIHTVLADASGNVISEKRTPTPAGGKSGAVVERIAKTITEVRAQAGVNKIKAVGIGAAGQLDIYRGVVLRSGNLGWRDVQLLELLVVALEREGLNAKPAGPEMSVIPGKKNIQPGECCPIFLDNDANLAALGEYKYGAGRGAGYLVYITVSTGIGGGIVISGEIYRGSGGAAGEIGHMTVERNGPLCSCGKRGCLEALASGTAIARRARELVAEGRGQGILKYLEGAYEITAVEVGRAAANGDIEARAILDRAGSALGAGIANVINLLNPSLVILGGGVMKIYDLMQEAVIFALQENVLDVPLSHVQVVPAQLGDRAGALGAAALALDNIK